MLDFCLLRCHLLSGILVALALGSGCSGRETGPQRFGLSGTVTYDGKPVPYGRIDLIPDASKGNSGPAAFAEIRDGQFNTAHSGKGIVGGPYQAVISGYSEERKPQTLSDEELAVNPPRDTTLFRDYKTTVEFPKETTIHNFEIPASPR